ncbi:MAG TPA: GntR family transcriptional regulator [Streptosporangiaceae bacterium]
MAEPIYRRIAEDLRLRIESGVLAPGSKLPTEVALRDRYQVSRNTIRDALKWLLNRGLVEIRHGQGTFVASNRQPFITTLSPDWRLGGHGPGGGEGAAARAEVAARHGTPRSSRPTVGVSRATGTVAARLGLSAGASVVTRHQELFIDDHPWSLQTSHYPMRLVERGAIRLLDAADLDEGTLSYLEQALGLTQVGYTDQILVRPPHEDEVRFFRGLADGRAPIAVLLRTGFTAGPDRPEPYRLTETRFPAERTQFVIHEGQVPELLAAAAEA